MSSSPSQEAMDRALALMPRAARFKSMNRYFMMLLIPLGILLLTHITSWLTISSSHLRVTLEPSSNAEALTNLFSPALDRAGDLSMRDEFLLVKYTMKIPDKWSVSENSYDCSSKLLHPFEDDQLYTTLSTSFDNAFESFPRNVIYDSLIRGGANTRYSELHRGKTLLQSSDDVIAVVPDNLMEDMAQEWVKWKYDFVGWQLGILAVHITIHLLSWVCTVVFLQEFGVWLSAWMYLAHAIAYIACLIVTTDTFNRSNSTFLVRYLFAENFKNWGLKVGIQDYGATTYCVLAFFTTLLGNLGTFVASVGHIGVFPDSELYDFTAPQVVAGILRSERNHRRHTEEAKLEGSASIV